MATLAQERPAVGGGDERFFLRSAIVMAAIIVAGFSFQLAMGRSTFASPLRVHAHAFLFMGWMGIYLLQNIFVSTGQMAWHRRLGWIAAVWLVPLVISGFVVTIAMVRDGHVPFFFQPLQFLIFDPMTVLAFAGLTVAAILLRRQTLWHRRLHYCAMSLLLGPAFGRLLPMPLLQPWGWEAAFAVSMLFPIIGAWSDFRRSGHVHPGWRWGIAAIVGTFIAIEAISYSAIGTRIYAMVTEDSAGAAVPPLEFAPPPEGPQRTGRP